MPSPNPRVIQLEFTVGSYGERLDALDEEVDSLKEEVAQLKERLTIADGQNKLFQHRIEQLEKEQDKWGGRLWAFVAGCVTVSAAALVTYLVRR